MAVRQHFLGLQYMHVWRAKIRFTLKLPQGKVDMKKCLSLIYILLTCLWFMFHKYSIHQTAKSLLNLFHSASKFMSLISCIVNSIWWIKFCLMPIHTRSNHLKRRKQAAKRSESTFAWLEKEKSQINFHIRRYEVIEKRHSLSHSRIS